MMNLGLGESKAPSIIRAALFLAATVMVLLRFVGLEADFPAGITWSGALYTDEGWYANAAVRHFLTGQWYLPGDFNPVTNMPLGQIVVRLSFSLFDMSLWSGRLTISIFFVLMVSLATRLVHSRFDWPAALLTALLLATNYVAFAFSRILVMEFLATCLVVSSLFAAGIAKGRRALVRAIAASILLSLAILTKTTMVFALPLLIYLAWCNGSDGRQRLKLIAVTLLLVTLVAGGYHLIAATLYPSDYAHFRQVNIGARLHQSAGAYLRAIPAAIVGLRALGLSLVGLSLLMTGLALALSQRYRREPLVHLLLGYVAAYLITLSVAHYGPPRYYLPLVVPLAGLSATAAVETKDWIAARLPSSRSLVAALPLLLILGVALGGCWKIVSYLSHPQYSFVRMMRDVRHIIDEREGASGVVLLGEIADSVAIETGMHAANAGLGVYPLRKKLRLRRPRYVLLHSNPKVVPAVEAEGGRVEVLASWDVFGNYYAKGKRVTLAHIHWRGSTLSPVRQ